MQSLWDQGLLASTLSYVGSLVADAVNVGSEDSVGGRWSVWEVVWAFRYLLMSSVCSESMAWRFAMLL